MNKALKNIIIGCIITAMAFPSSICGFETGSAIAKGYTIGELKAQYGEADSKYMFKPFYNVEQTTTFTFNFNSKVDPVKAVTVHTDIECKEASTVYQINDGYRTDEGVAVVVNPNDPVLGSDGRNDAKNKCWGYAPIYYLCVRYDLDSKEVKKLEEPIIIPFTIKHKVNTPTAYTSVDSTGTFSVNWLPVEKAVSYKIYQGGYFAPQGYTSAEIGYVNSDFKLIDTVDSSKLQYIPKYEDYKFVGEEAIKVYNDENLRVDQRTGEIEAQNANNRSTYFITAVDENGNESAFSEGVSAQFYSSSLPYRVNKYLYSETEFLQTMSVLAIDGETVVNYPINYYRIEEPTENSTSCQYKYEIIGTKLGGTMKYYKYKNPELGFPEQVISSHKKQTIEVPEIPVAKTPDINLDTILDEDYRDSSIDLLTPKEYPAEAKIPLDPASLIRRVDLELTRIMGNGLYSKPLDSIETYVLTDNPEYIYKNENGVITVTKATNTDTKISDEVMLSKKTKLESSPSKKIDSSNYVEEQRKSTYKQVKEADKEVIQDTKYPVFADTAGQKYLALCLINQEKEISLKAFPEYQNFETFVDDLYYVWYQNPYIMGFDPNKVSYISFLQKATIEYNLDTETAKKQQEELYQKGNEIINNIIKDNMSDQEKIVQIWNYLEENAEYNYEANNYIAKGATDYYIKYPNSWNSYGILCENLGVCQSYASAFNLLTRLSGIESVMVTGTLNNGGHAWNAVKLNGKWYMIDITNNKNALGIPYWICNSSTQFIKANGFSLNDKFIDGKDLSNFEINDAEADWYNINNSLVTTPKELVDIWRVQKDITAVITVKYDSKLNLDQFINEFKQEAINMGFASNELDSWKYACVDGILELRR